MQRRERGSASIWLVGMLVTMVAVLGLVVDATRQLSLLREASTVAATAARAGAQEQEIGVYRSTATPQLGADAAATARGYLASAGYSGSVTVSGADITVTASTTWSPIVMPIGSKTITATHTFTATVEEG